MHSLTHFLHKHNSRDPTPPIEKEDSTESWYSSLSAPDSRSSIPNEHAKGIPINQRRNSGHHRSGRSPLEFASSPRDRYPNFASYFRDVMEGRGSPSQNQHHQHHVSSHRSIRNDNERYQTSANTYQASRHDYRHFVSPIYNDVMDDIQENEFSKCEQYGEISNTKLNHLAYKSRFDNKSFAQKLVESTGAPKEGHGSHDRRGSGSSASGNHKHKHSIQELIRTFSKKVGHWRHESGEGRRGSCAVPPVSKERTSDNDEFRSRSKSLDGDHMHKVLRKSVLDDCGATYHIFDTIVKEGAYLRRAASQEAGKRRSSLGNVSTARHRASDAFLDPHHAAMLFRDSRGLPVADPFLEKVSLSDLGNFRRTASCPAALFRVSGFIFSCELRAAAASASASASARRGGGSLAGGGRVRARPRCQVRVGMRALVHN
ncbi:unnamed protein product, partial [Iphiclides podalirius]